MIRTFKDREAQKIFKRQHSKKLSTDIQRIVLRKLRMVNRALNINDLRVPPANHLEKLKGNRAGQYSIKINNAWRICFEWHSNEAFKVEIVNYHKG